MHHSLRSVLRLLCAVSTFALWGCQGAIQGNASNDAPLGDDETLQIIDGLEFFAENGCAGCHCNDASGGCNLNAPPLQGKEFTVDTLRQRLVGLRLTNDGIDHPLKLNADVIMPGDFEALSGFLRTVGDRERAVVGDSQISLGYALYNDANCIVCHLSSAQGQAQGGLGQPIAGTDPENIYQVLTSRDTCGHPVRLEAESEDCPGVSPMWSGETEGRIGEAIRRLTDVAAPEVDDDRVYLGYFLTFVSTPPVAGFEVCLNRPGDICTVAGAGVGAFNFDNLAAPATFMYYPQEVNAVDWDRDGDLELGVVDWNNHRLRIVDIDDMSDPDPLDANPELVYSRVFSIAGTGKVTGDDALNHPTDMDFDAQGNLVQANWHNQNIYYHPNQLANGADRQQLAGLCDIGCANDVAEDGSIATTPVMSTLISLPSSIQFHPDGRIFFAESGCGRIRILDTRTSAPEKSQPFQCLTPVNLHPAATITTLAGTVACPVDAVTGKAVCGPNRGYAGDGGPARDAVFRVDGSPVVVDFGIHFSPFNTADGNPDYLYIADSRNHAIRRIDLRVDPPMIELFAGLPDSTMGGMVDGDRITAARFNRPQNVTVDPAGNVYVADFGNSAVRRIDIQTGMVTTIAGTGRAAFNGDNQPATSATLSSPGGVWVHPEDGRIFIADTFNNRIRVICPAEGCPTPPPEAQAALELLASD